jgi:N-acetyltransferase 10
MGIRTAHSVLEKMGENKNVTERSGIAVDKISAEELGLIMTPHDMKRLELYGRNLCDHHLITDLLPTVARLYFLGRFGKAFKLSSVQSAILCGIGVQNRVVDSLTKELGLPSNQVLAMFNKAIRKISIALYSIIEDKEKENLLNGDKRMKAREAVEGMRDVAPKTLEEDAAEAATAAIKLLNNSNENSLPSTITNDRSLMQYTIKGSDEQWDNILDGKEVSETGMVSVASVRDKRKSVDAEDMEKEDAIDKERKGNKKAKGSKKKKSRRS